jgi:hypothetical protein
MRAPTLLVLALPGACTMLVSPRAGSLDPEPPRLAAAAEAAAVPAAPAPRKLLGGGSSTRIKGGAFYPAGDVSGLDTGFWGEAVFANEIIPLVSIEGSVGYVEAEGQRLGLPFDLQGIPVFVNGRLQVPILFFTGYGGAGIGGVWLDYELGGVGSDDWVAAWNAFAGIEIGLGGFGVGAEAKYLQTDKTKDGFALEGTSAVLYVSFGF